MRKKLFEHILSILLIFSVFYFVIETSETKQTEVEAGRFGAVQPYLEQEWVDLNNSLHRAILAEALRLHYKETPATADSIIRQLEAWRVEQFTNPEYKTGGRKRGLTNAKIKSLTGQYLTFLFIYAVVMLLTYYAVQSLALFRFVKKMQGRTSYLRELKRLLLRPHIRMEPGRKYRKAAGYLLKALLKAVMYLVLFSPAYVTAYALRTRFETDTMLFMIILGVFSNGLLINYANKFYTFLVTESRKGYVDTARVKNLVSDFSHSPGGIPLTKLFLPLKSFPGHILQHIYINARYQFIPAMKEMASFLITGLIIIEMALNIQGYMNYEMMQNILYQDYAVVIAIMFCVFLTVKVTEIAVDAWHWFETRRYQNH